MNPRASGKRAARLMLKRCESTVISSSVAGVTCASFRVTSRQENSSNCALSLAAPEIRSASATANARFVTLSLRVFTARVNLRFISCSAAASSLLSCAAALSCAAVRSFEGTRTAGSFRGADIRFGEERSPGNSAATRRDFRNLKCYAPFTTGAKPLVILWSPLALTGSRVVLWCPPAHP